MEAIKIQRKIDSETLHIPELKRFLGKFVEIILLEVPSSESAAMKGDIKEFISAANRIDIDEKAIQRLREESMI